jgi:uncharacterized hydrophobic protein (TIGR00271 family)
MPILELFKLTQTERNKFCQHIIESSAPRVDFYFLVILSTLIVALGLLADNVILVIGGMLVTPLLSPILALALGIVINEQKVIKWTLRVLLMSFALAIAVALIVGLITSSEVTNIALINIMKPSLFTFIVALVAGFAASFAWAKPSQNETLPGVAVTVTLIPPLTAIGLLLAKAEWALFRDVLNVLLLNIFGIIVASLLTFSLMDFYKARARVLKEVKEEEKIMEKTQKNNIKDNS